LAYPPDVARSLDKEKNAQVYGCYRKMSGYGSLYRFCAWLSRRTFPRRDPRRIERKPERGDCNVVGRRGTNPGNGIRWNTKSSRIPLCANMSETLTH